ncbi:MAG TPA: hypothetical protein VF039_08520 [Longimicrobiales bacterium]
MRTMLRAGRFVFAALIAVALAGCDSSESFAPPVDPGFAAFEADVVGQAAANGISVDVAELAEELPLSMSQGGGEFVFVQGQVGDEAVEGVIGPRGGVLNLGQHWLLVPQNAVRNDTRFVMTPISDGTFHVDLTATRVSHRGTESLNDVGKSGFRKTVFLAFYYGDAPVDPAALQVAWLQSSGNLVTQPTYIFQDGNGDEWAVGALRHFSGYVLVAN